MIDSKTRTRILPVLAMLLFVFVGCDSNDNGSDNNDNNSSGNGSFTAQIDGNSFDAVRIEPILEDGVLGIGANLEASSPTQQQFNIAIPNATEGTHQIGLLVPVTATYTVGVDVYVGSSGSIIIDELTDEGASGTFEFTAMNTAQQSVNVTNGRFDVNF